MPKSSGHQRLIKVGFTAVSRYNGAQDDAQGSYDEEPDIGQARQIQLE